MSRVIFSSKPAAEKASLVFDFTSRCAASETLSSTSVTASVYSGSDSNPQGIITGSGTISGQTVSQMVLGGTLGVVYLVTCQVITSTGQILFLSGFLSIVAGDS